MRILLDTHALLWFFSGNPKLSKNATAIFLDSDNELFFSAASYWEICLKVLSKKLVLSRDWQPLLDEQIKENGIHWLDISRQHLKQTLRLPLIHKDPFDRLLIAQALVEKLVLLTIDENIQRYSIKTVW